MLMKKTYIEFIVEILKKVDVGKPIYVHEIAVQLANTYNISIKKASGAASLAIKRIIDGNLMPNLKFYQKGIYYLAVTTPFGETTIDKEELIKDKYLKNDSGYETGSLLLHKLGLTTQIPNERHLVSNNAKDCARLDSKLGVIVHPAKTKIDFDNKQYFEILDVLTIMDEVPIDCEQPYSILNQYINKLGLEYVKLLALADSYYNKNTILRLAHVAKG